MFEPMLEDLLPQLRKAGVRVQEVWTFDMPLCGETAKVNPIGYLYGSIHKAKRMYIYSLTNFQ